MTDNEEFLETWFQNVSENTDAMVVRPMADARPLWTTFTAPRVAEGEDVAAESTLKEGDIIALPTSPLTKLKKRSTKFLLSVAWTRSHTSSMILMERFAQSF